MIKTQPAIDFKRLRRQLESSKNQSQFNKRVANEVFKQKLGTAYLFLGFITFYVVDDEQTVRLAAVSDTEHYRLAVRGYEFEPSEFRLSLKDDHSNDIVKSIVDNKTIHTTDWGSLRRRGADIKQTRLNQANSGIAYSALYPLKTASGGALLFCYYQYQENIGEEQRLFMSEYSRLVSDVANKHQFSE
jgi:hypothetical protein